MSSTAPTPPKPPAPPAPEGIILDKRKKLPFVMVERVILRATGLSNNAKLLYLFLVDYAGEKGSCFPGQARLAADLGARSVDTVQRALAELRRHRLIDWQRRGQNRPNVYLLLDLEGSTLTRNSPARAPLTRERAAINVQVDTARLRSPETALVRSKRDTAEPDSAFQQQAHAAAQKYPSIPVHAAPVVDDLLQRGVSARAARSLVAAYDPRRLREKIDLLDYLLAIESPLVSKNPAGWLRMAIVENYVPPVEYLKKRDGQQRHAERRQALERAEAEALRERAQTLAGAPDGRARRWLAVWEQGRAALRQPPLSAREREERLRALTATFSAERDAFFAEHPELARMAGQGFEKGAETGDAL